LERRRDVYLTAKLSSCFNSEARFTSVHRATVAAVVVSSIAVTIKLR